MEFIKPYFDTVFCYWMHSLLNNVFNVTFFTINLSINKYCCRKSHIISVKKLYSLFYLKYFRYYVKEAKNNHFILKNSIAIFKLVQCI